ncbi:MAG: Gfo/Idh/MocA family oxidoreductase [Chloroflexi bacterium]|nr:Gfo/Idh/MocA family oxidoreductase [Chloroflexota bacterium]
MQAVFNHEYPARLKAGYIGTGEQSLSNILPCFQYAPVELVAFADHNTTRGLAVARQFGARHFYPNHKAMLAQEKLDAVFMVVGPDVQGKPRYAELAEYALRQGVHVWVDSPPCASLAEVKQFTYGLTSRGKWMQANFPKMFAPAYLKANDIIHSEPFGNLSSFALRYPAALPPAEVRANTLAMAPFLADFLQAYSILLRLFGECDGLFYLRSSLGDVSVTLHYRSGLVGNMHLTGSQALTSPTERLEIVGNGANLVVENGVKLTYYRSNCAPGEPEEERATSFIGSDENAPLVWEPDMSLGAYYNKSLFVQGNVGSVLQFANKILAKEPPRHGNISDLMHMMIVYEKLRDGAEKSWLSLF